ncbi:podocan-like isoform X1 [Oryzias latipes]|uniref:Wu:fc23c09 n=2 Tax=Oryzias latipes TaxID=8090 RepID=A0A3B3HB03_ORYLA|nr:podocan-like isoform X1 [Oryzias latipes]
MMQKMADEENEMKRGTNSTKSEAEEMEEEKRAVKEDIFRLKPEDQEAPPTNRNSKTCTQSPNPSTSFPLFSHQKVPPSSPEMPFPKDLKLEHEEVKVYLGLLAADKSNFVNPAEPEPHRNMISEAERGEFIFTVQEENPNEPEVTITNLRAKETKATQTPHQNEQGGKFVSSSWKLKPNNTREKTKAIGVDSTHPGKPSRASSALTQINKPSTIPSTTPSSRTMQIDEEHTKKTTKKEKKRRKEDKTQKTPGRRNKSSTPTHFPDFMENYCPLECVCYGRVVQCSDKNVDKIPYGIPYNAIYILLMNNQINSIQLDLLNQYDSLDFLVLSNNRLTDGAVKGAFKRVQSLKRLYLDRNLLESVPVDLPASLEELWLDSNHLRVMLKAAWTGCPSLSVLSLSNNSLGSGSQSIPKGVFSPLSNLRTLNMDNNQLASVPMDLPLSVKELYLKGNLLKQFPGGIFRGISRLMVLDLSANRLTNRGLLKDSLLNTTHLESLNLERNRLKQVPRHLPASLKTLNLNENLISSIKKAAFSDLKSMEHLSLAKNKIAKVAAGAFRTLSALHQLDLSYNILHQVPRHLPQALHSVALSHNRIQSVPHDAFCWGNKTLSGLVRVQLEHNFIDFGEMDARAFSCLRGSQVVHFY